MSRKKKISSALIDEDAKAKIEKAAEAIGLTPEALINMVMDSGLAGTPPQDGLSEVMTLKDLGHRLHLLVSARPQGERAKWFAGLVPTQQSALITVLREKGYASATIANDLGISPLKVTETYNKYADSLGANVINTRLSTLAGHLQLAAERAQQGAMEDKDWSTFWRVQKEFVALLQSIGVVDRAAQKIEIDQHVSIGVEQKREEIKKILALEKKRQIRVEEIKRSEEERVDNAEELSGDMFGP